VAEEKLSPEEKVQPPSEPKATLVPTTISWEHGASTVAIKGSFSEWKELPLSASDNYFTVSLDLNEGEHHLKFCVDGNWTVNNSMKIVDMEGEGQVNLVVVSRSEE